MAAVTANKKERKTKQKIHTVNTNTDTCKMFLKSTVKWEL